MANEGMDFELLVNIKKAEQQIDKFIKDTEKKFNKTNYSPIGSGSKGGGSKGASSTNKVLNDQKKAYEKLKQQRIKANEQRIRDEEKANQNIQKQRQKANQDRVNEAKRVNQQIQKIRRDALHKYEMMEIQRNRAGQNATEQSKRMRIEYEREISRITSRASSSNLAQVKQELAKELATRRKALDQRIMSERQAAAQQLASKNHAQKQASKFNNTMFQVQQAVEDASYAGFRGASNNLALMANQLGGPGGTIALMGLMATTMTPTIAKMIGFGEETKIAADEVERLTQSIKRNNDAKLNAQIETNSLPLTPKELSQRKEDLNTRKRNFEARRRNFNSQKNFAAQSINTRLFNDEVRKQLAFSKTMDSPLPGIFLNDKTTQEKIKNMGINQADIKGKTTQETLQNLANELHAKAAIQEQKLFDSQNDLSAKEFRGMQIKSGEERGLLDRKNLLEISNKIKDDQTEVRRGLLDEQKNLEELSKSLGTNNKTVTDVMGILDKGTDLVDFSKYKTGDVPHTQEDRLKQQNSLMEDQLQQRVDDIKKNFGTFIEDKVNWITRATTDSSREWRASQSKIMVEEKQKEITSELQKQTDLYTKKIDANNQLIDILDKVENAHKRISRETEKNVKTQQKKIESLKEALTLTKQEYQYDKLGAQSTVEEIKINNQSEKQMKQAKNFASKRFDPMIKYLQYMSKSPVFGQQASQQLQAVQNAKATLLQKAQQKISKLTEKKLYKEKQNLIGKQSTFLQDKANAAGSSGNFEMQQKYLEQLQALKLQASGSSKTPQEAQKYLKEADSIQNQLVKSMSNQITTEKQSLNELTKIEAQLAQIKSILQGNPNSAQAKQAQSTLNGLQSKVTAINEGKPLPNVAMPTPTLPAATAPVPKKWAGKYSAFSNQPTVPAPPVTQPVPPRVNPAPIVPQDKPQSLKDIIKEMERDSVTQTQSVQAQSVTQAQANQTMTNSATISNAVINSATINGVINDKTPTPAVAGSSVSNVMNNRFGSLNVNVKGPRLPNIGKQLQRQARNQSIRMG